MRKLLAVCLALAINSPAYAAAVAKIAVDVPVVGVAGSNSFTPPLFSSVIDDRYTGIIESGSVRVFPLSEAEMAQPAVLETLHQKDPSIYSHVMRVGILAGMIALAMGYPLGTAQHFAWGARLHDTGKIDDAIRAIVNREGPLSADDRKFVQRHPEIGWEMLSRQADIPLEIRSAGMSVALAHHEKVDGTGYPKGLKGDAIPIEARIAAVADHMDALLENRPYRAGMPISEALKIMEAEKSAFDPQAYKALLGIFSGF